MHPQDSDLFSELRFLKCLRVPVASCCTIMILVAFDAFTINLCVVHGQHKPDLQNPPCPKLIEKIQKN